MEKSKLNCDNILEVWEDLPEDATELEIQQKANAMAKELVREKIEDEYGADE